jgi:hypothetical protein
MSCSTLSQEKEKKDETTKHNDLTIPPPLRLQKTDTSRFLRQESNTDHKKLGCANKLNTSKWQNGNRYKRKESVKVQNADMPPEEQTYKRTQIIGIGVESR